MDQKLLEIFKKVKYQNEPMLAQDIWSAILARERRLVHIKLSLFALIAVSSLAGVVSTIKILLSDLSQSGFYEYFSLIFSDSKSIASYWKEFILSLGESLPLVSTLMVFSLIFVFFLSLRYFTKQIIKGQLNFANS